MRDRPVPELAGRGREAWPAVSGFAQLRSGALRLWRRSNLATGTGRAGECASCAQIASRPSCAHGGIAGRLPYRPRRGHDLAHLRWGHGWLCAQSRSCTLTSVNTASSRSCSPC